ncbi:MAG TPA: DUF2242 domain-containing protein [Pararobbsia sp.]|nr:DUF2242 domain-containing protein [Pararobbsia sp.]
MQIKTGLSSFVFLTLSCSALVLLSACSSTPKPLYQSEQFDSKASPFARNFNVGAASTCQAARRALLSQGYMTTSTRFDLVDGSKNFQPDSDSHVTIEFHVVCTSDDPDSANSTAYVSAVQDRYTLKKTSTSASVGLSVLGSVSLPIGSSDDSLVKIASETIPAGVFYDRFFNLVKYYIDTAPEKPAPVKPVAPPPPMPEPVKPPHAEQHTASDEAATTATPGAAASRAAIGSAPAVVIPATTAPPALAPTSTTPTIVPAVTAPSAATAMPAVSAPVTTMPAVSAPASATPAVSAPAGATPAAPVPASATPANADVAATAIAPASTPDAPAPSHAESAMQSEASAPAVTTTAATDTAPAPATTSGTEVPASTPSK